jgi:hypothetical protein
MTELCVLDRTGDTRTIFDPDNPDEVEAARETFHKLKKKGYIAYSVKKDGEKGEVLTEFDPRAGKIILAPPLRGG